MGNFAKLSITSFLEILRFLSLRWYQFPGTCNCHSLTWNKFVEHLARIWSMCNIPDENRSRKTTGSVSLWLGSSQHSSVCSLSTALKLHHQFKSFQQHQFQVKSLTSTLYSEFFASHTLFGMFPSKIEVFPAIYSSDSMEKGIQKSNLPLTACN